MPFVQKLELVCERRPAGSDGFAFQKTPYVLLEIKC